mgnify:CR=1 FL=1
MLFVKDMLGFMFLIEVILLRKFIMKMVLVVEWQLVLL